MHAVPSTRSSALRCEVAELAGRVNQCEVAIASITAGIYDMRTMNAKLKQELTTEILLASRVQAGAAARDYARKLEQRIVAFLCPGVVSPKCSTTTVSDLRHVLAHFDDAGDIYPTMAPRSLKMQFASEAAAQLIDDKNFRVGVIRRMAGLLAACPTLAICIKDLKRHRVGFSLGHIQLDAAGIAARLEAACAAMVAAGLPYDAADAEMDAALVANLRMLEPVERQVCYHTMAGAYDSSHCSSISAHAYAYTP